ncbi:metallophosphoesterase [Cytophagaceae bacterium ABcell3]|nr:metallophosphoesterase [Cytophagaceae bacterium ABcell3]
MREVIVSMLFFAFFGGIDIYAFQAVRVACQKVGKNKKKIIYAIYWSVSIFALLGFLGFIFRIGQVPHSFRGVFSAIVLTGYLTKLFIAFFVLADDIRRFTLWVKRKLNTSPAKSEGGKGTPITRSQFLAKSGLLVSAIPFASMVKGVLHGIHDYRIKRVRLSLPNLPDSFVGKTIAQISDIHSGSFFGLDEVRKGVQMLMAEKPDVVFFTGDIVNNKAEELDRFLEVFSEVKAPMGVYSILGNHDYGDYVRHWTAEDREKNMVHMVRNQQEMGWDLLRNENRTLKIGNDEIAIIGVENWGKGERWPKYGDMEKAYKGVEDKPIKLLLSHDPSHWSHEVIQKFPDINVTFSGHTHGFQFGIRAPGVQWSPVQYVYDHWAGLYQHQNQFLYVNVGFGFIGFPGRVGMPPEITLFELAKT